MRSGEGVSDTITVSLQLLAMRVVIGFGGNLGFVDWAFRKAVDQLGAVPGLMVERRSALISSPAVGPPQPDYLNAAILLSSELGLKELLHQCQRIERSAGRERDHEVRWGPRTLDLDLLIAEGLVCRGPALELPHPRFGERAFALIPAAQVAPDWRHPLTGRSLVAMADAVRNDGINTLREIDAW